MLSLRADVTLVPVGPEHAAAMYRWVSQPELSADLGLRQSPDLNKTLAWIGRASQDRQVVARAVQWAGQHVGNVIVDHVDPLLQTGRLSVYIGEPAARGQGIGLTGLYLALREAFDQLGLYKIWLTVHAQNVRAVNTYVKLGFSLEGIQRGEFWLGDRRVNLLYMGLLAEEFRQLPTEFTPAAA